MVTAHIIDAFAVDTGSGQTLVQIQLTILALEACRAVADIGTVIIVACAIVQTRIRNALVDVDLAISALVAAEEINRFKDKLEILCIGIRNENRNSRI